MVKALKFGERHELRCPIRASKEDQADSGSSPMIQVVAGADVGDSCV